MTGGGGGGDLYGMTEMWEVLQSKLLKESNETSQF